MKYQKLFEPFSIGRMRLKNRIVMGPMGTSLCDERSTPTQRFIDYYEERAKGGAGLVIVEHAYPQKLGIKSERSAGLWDWDTLPAWKATVEAIHRHGAQAAIEIGHLGRCTDYPSSIGEKAMAPSAVRCPVAQAPTRAVGREEIEAYKSDYLNAVRLARTAGFDAVELHFANGYFLAEWISGRSNKRTDRYGGTFGNRARLALELTELVREEVGPDYPLLARFASQEVNGGRGIEESRVFAKLLEEAGVNCLDINAGSPSEYDWEFPSYFQPQGFLLEDIERIRRSVSIPVIGGGRITEPQMAECALLDGRLDLVSINRGLIADPAWPAKVRSGREEQIRRCVGCTCCINEKERRKGIVCTVNPFVGRERELAIRRADAEKRILVVGGGPAGLQAAVVAARQGHRVSLVEQERQLGGMVRAAGVPPMKWDILSLIPALAAEAEALGVKIRTNCRVEPDRIAPGAYDLVVLATGQEPFFPCLWENDGSLRETTAVALLNGESWCGERVALIGGGMVGCECAEFLSEYGKKVTLFEMKEGLAQDAYWNIRDQLLQRMKKYEVRAVTGAAATAVRKRSIVCMENEAERSYGPFDTMVSAVGLREAATMEGRLRERGIRCVVIRQKEGASGIQRTLTAAVETMLALENEK